MITYGGSSVLSLANYDNNIDSDSGGDVPILSVAYDPNTYTATLTIDTSDPQWLPGTRFRLRIFDEINNACSSHPSGGDLDVYFTTVANISGRVLNNVDGLGIFGAKVELQDASCIPGSTCSFTTTNLSGNFNFSGFAPGSYTLVQTDLQGYSSVSDTQGINDNRILFTLPASGNSTGHLFTDTPAPCLGGSNFVASTIPANNALGVSLGTNTLVVTFNQPMITSGGGSVLSLGNFDNNIDSDSGGDVPILSIAYDPNTYTATLSIDTSDPQWLPGSRFRLRIHNSLRNACGVNPSGSDVDVYFRTDLVISGQVRFDTDGDGDLTDLDQGIAGVSIKLGYGTCVVDGTCRTAITNSGGFFSFSGLVPGSYTLIETDPVGYVSTNDSQGGNDNQISITLSAGAHSVGHKFLDKLGP